MFKIDLDKGIIETLRDAINEHQDFSIKVSFNNRNAWNSICSILDRIDDLVVYLNSLELKPAVENSGFDFQEFINASGVLIECVERLAKIYKVKLNYSKNIFKDKYINEKVKEIYIQENKLDDKDNDYQYFKYLRSLGSLHPVKTNNHLIYMSDDLEVSPFVRWNEGILYDKNKGDIIIVVYSETEDFKHIFVKINETFDFIKYMYNFINDIVTKIKSYNDSIIKELKNTKIKSKAEFENYRDYLNNLIEESEKRCPALTNDITEARDIIYITITNSENVEKYNKFCNAITYSIDIVHNCLQNMNFDFSSDNDNLIFELLNPSNTFTMESYHYQLEKINYLKGDYGDPEFGKIMFKIMLPLLKKYVLISEDDVEYNVHYYELYVLSRVALYFNNLNNDSLVNAVIPQNPKYRI